MTSWAPFGPFSTHSHFAYFKPFSFRSTELVQDKEKAFNPILVKFRLFDQKVKIMKRWKILKANTIGKDVEKVNINENLSAFIQPKPSLLFKIISKG